MHKSNDFANEKAQSIRIYFPFDRMDDGEKRETKAGKNEPTRGRETDALRSKRPERGRF